MIKQSGGSRERRARNIIWNAAGDYGIHIPFLSYFPNGDPDLYFDMIIGLSFKWFDMDLVNAFFRTYERDRRSDQMDSLLWLGIENCVYEKEVKQRPVMKNLREKRALGFYEAVKNLSRQQMMYLSVSVYNQHEYRWAGIAGKKLPMLSPREKRMASALLFSGELGTDGLLRHMEDFLSDYFGVKQGSGHREREHAMQGIHRILRHEHQRKDLLMVRAGSGEGDHERSVLQQHTGLGRFQRIRQEDLNYIQALWGDDCITEKEKRELENLVCTGPHSLCRIKIVKGNLAGGVNKKKQGTSESLQKASSGPAVSKKVWNTLESMHLQEERNLVFFKEHESLIRHNVRSLSAHLDTVLTSCMKHLPEKAGFGRIRSEAAWRLPVLQDQKVFLKEGEETETDLVVDLLLDASQSRMNTQEIIASEAYMIVKSLETVHIPTGVITFRSLRSHMILEVLKNRGDHDLNGIFRYYAGGWNRDALALKVMGEWGGEVPVKEGVKRILLVLTDGNPNDSTPYYDPDTFRNREYEGAIGIRDTQETVQELKEKGITVGAVFCGLPVALENIEQIYGKNYVHIRKMNQLATAVGDLLLKLVEEAEN